MIFLVALTVLPFLIVVVMDEPLYPEYENIVKKKLRVKLTAVLENLFPDKPDT